MIAWHYFTHLHIVILHALDDVSDYPLALTVYSHNIMNNVCPMYMIILHPQGTRTPVLDTEAATAAGWQPLGQLTTFEVGAEHCQQAATIQIVSILTCILNCHDGYSAEMFG